MCTVPVEAGKGCWILRDWIYRASTWMLRTESKSSRRAASILNCGAISPAYLLQGCVRAIVHMVQVRGQLHSFQHVCPEGQTQVTGLGSMKLWSALTYHPPQSFSYVIIYYFSIAD